MREFLKDSMLYLYLIILEQSTGPHQFRNIKIDFISFN